MALLVIRMHINMKRKFSLKNIEAKFEELGKRSVFTIEKMKRGGQAKIVLHHKQYQGRVEVGEIPDQKLIYVSAWGNEEERLTSSWIEWMIRYFSIRISNIEIFPENAKVGQD